MTSPKNKADYDAIQFPLGKSGLSRPPQGGDATIPVGGVTKTDDERHIIKEYHTEQVIREMATMNKTHFLYDDGQGKLLQVGLCFLPYIPHPTEEVSFIALSRETHLYEPVGHWRVDRVTYELYGECLPVSKTWENGSSGRPGYNIVIYVTPLDDLTWAYIQQVREAEEATSDE